MQKKEWSRNLGENTCKMKNKVSQMNVKIEILFKYQLFYI
jgi:hypothetical protein